MDVITEEGTGITSSPVFIDRIHFDIACGQAIYVSLARAKKNVFFKLFRESGCISLTDKVIFVIINISLESYSHLENDTRQFQNCSLATAINKSAAIPILLCNFSLRDRSKLISK